MVSKMGETLLARPDASDAPPEKRAALKKWLADLGKEGAKKLGEKMVGYAIEHGADMAQWLMQQLGQYPGTTGP